MIGHTYEACLTCGQLIMSCDEGCCNCDLSGEQKNRVQLSDLKQADAEISNLRAALDADEGRIFRLLDAFQVLANEFEEKGRDPANSVDARIAYVEAAQRACRVGAAAIEGAEVSRFTPPEGGSDD